MMRFHSRCMGSQLVEDGLRDCRQCEAAAPNKKAAPKTLMAAMVASSTLHTRHRYDEPRTSGNQKMWRNAGLPEDAFRPSAKESSLDLSGIKSTTQKTSWFSPSADRTSLPWSDLALLRQGCVVAEEGAEPRLQGLEEAWQGGLLAGDNMVVRKKGTEVYTFVLGHFSESAVVGIDAVEDFLFVGEACSKHWCLPKVVTLRWFAVSNWDDYEAMPVTWLSPLGQLKRWPLMRTADRSLSVRAFVDTTIAQDHKPLPVVHVAAHRAFWQLPIQTLKEIAKSLSIDEVGFVCILMYL